MKTNFEQIMNFAFVAICDKWYQRNIASSGILM
jgi:hypothetical protein